MYRLLSKHKHQRHKMGIKNKRWKRKRRLITSSVAFSVAFLLYFYLIFGFVYESLYNEAVFHGCQEPPHILQFASTHFHPRSSLILHLLSCHGMENSANLLQSIHEPSESTFINLNRYTLLGELNTQINACMFYSLYLNLFSRIIKIKAHGAKKTDDTQKKIIIFHLLLLSLLIYSDCTYLQHFIFKC